MIRFSVYHFNGWLKSSIDNCCKGWHVARMRVIPEPIRTHTFPWPSPPSCVPQAHYLFVVNT
jgi:hypothetical protein